MDDTVNDHEAEGHDAPEPAATAVAGAAPAPAPVASLDNLIDQWVSTEIVGSEFADTPERWNAIRAKVENLKNLLKIKE